MRRLVGILALVLLVAVLTPGPARAQNTAAALKAQMEADSHIQFTVPAAFTEKVKGDELQVGDKDIFCAISTGQSVDAMFDMSTTILKKMGGDSFQVRKGPASDTEAGITGKYASGTLQLEGKELSWMIFVFDAGGKPLGMTLLGAKLLDSPHAKALVDSVRKKEP